MTSTVKTALRQVVARFALAGAVESIDPHGAGHINDTYEITARSRGGVTRRFILQRINRNVFFDPEAVMHNIEQVIDHLAVKVREEGGEADREIPALVPADDGRSFVRDAESGVWRCFARIEGATAHATVVDPARVRTVAATFGRFLRRMADFPADRLEVSIPEFHDARAVLRSFRDTVHLDSLGRAGAAAAECRFVEAQADLMAEWGEWIASVRTPTQAVHNDTKVNNVLIDDESGNGLCVIDLDTVMAGSRLVDIGDCARSVLTGLETTGQPLDLRLFEAVVRGFAEEVGGLLSDEEVERIALATRAIALELGTRFLSDYLAGDRWFPASGPAENLERSRVQFDLVRDIGLHEVEMKEIVRGACR
jgi:Ser/Thr protein kinase RdoA (MazF antagonist)